VGWSAPGAKDAEDADVDKVGGPSPEAVSWSGVASASTKAARRFEASSGERALIAAARRGTDMPATKDRIKWASCVWVPRSLPPAGGGGPVGAGLSSSSKPNRSATSAPLAPPGAKASAGKVPGEANASAGVGSSPSRL